MAEVGELPGSGRPWGDIIQVQTPNLDRISQQFQQMALDRKAYAQKESLATEELMNKELANVRGIDMPDVTDAYNKWKSTQQNLLFNKRLQMNPKEYNAAQMEANSALGNVRGLINKSAQLSQFGKQLAQDRTTPGKSNLYSDDFGDKQTAFWNTPLSQIQNHSKYGDLTNPDNYRYKGAQTNFAALEKNAMGTPTAKYQKEEQISPLQKNITPYTFGNTPAQYQESLRGAYSTNKQTYRDASAAWEAIPDQEKNRVDQMYSQLPPEKWQQMGLSGPQAIAPTNSSDPADNLAAYKAKLYAINNNPAAGKVYSNIDQGAKQAATFNHQELMEAIKEGNREKLKTLGHQFKQMDIKAQSSVLDDTYNSIIDDAKKSGTTTYKTSDGQVSKQYEIKVSPEIRKEFSFDDDKGHKIYPDAFRIDENGSTVTPIFFKGTDPGNAHAYRGVDAGLSKPMTSVEFKARLGKALFGAKEAVKESANSSGGGQTDFRNKYGY